MHSIHFEEGKRLPTSSHFSASLSIYCQLCNVYQESWRSSVAQSCPPLCHPRGLQHTRLPCSLPSPRIAQTRVCWVDDVIQSSHPLSSPSPPAFHPSQHQSLIQRVGSSHQVAKVLELQHQSFQWIFGVNLL